MRNGNAWGRFHLGHVHGFPSSLYSLSLNSQTNLHSAVDGDRDVVADRMSIALSHALIEICYLGPTLAIPLHDQQLE